MDIEVMEVVDFMMIFDEKVGDILCGCGWGNFCIFLFCVEEFQMFGNVIVIGGDYLFMLYDVINKDFCILFGGVISWNGDLFDV